MVILNRKQAETLGQRKLEEAKKTIQVLVMDQDGTLKGGDDPQYQKADVASLLRKIASAGKLPVILAASGASALKSFAEVNFSAYAGIGNGTALYKFNQDGKTQVFNHGLSLEEVKSLVEIWKKVYKEAGVKEEEFQPKGIATFKEFSEKDWSGYIPEEYVEVFKQYGGRCFTEEIKVTVVFPAWKEEKQRELVGKMQKALDRLAPGKYKASRGDENFLHLTRALEIDPKLFALKKIMEELSVKPEEIAVFGDLPLDNDRGMLVESGLPYTFTNRWIESLTPPPYLLPGSSKSMVGSVHRAIDYLLG